MSIPDLPHFFPFSRVSIGIIGSREFHPLKDVEGFVRTLPPSWVVVSGGARGVDQTAARIAAERGMRVKVFRPDWLLFGHAAGMIRNQLIVDNSTFFAAFWDGRSRGTLDTIRKALKADKRVIYGGAAPRPEDL